jgi:hypothetical protein
MISSSGRKPSWVAVTSIKPTSEAVVAFLKVLDRTVKPTRKIELYLGGGAAVLLAYDGSQPTVDVDAIGESTAILRELEDVAGRNSDIHRLTGFYLDIVPPGKFPSAQGWQGRCQPVDIPHLESLRIYVLEPHDLVISKLGPMRFGAKDREDIRDVCDNVDLRQEVLLDRYREARQRFDRDEQERMDEHFRFVESEFLGLTPTDF